MNLRSQKRLAARLLKAGLSRVRIRQEKDAEEALTRNDIKLLIKKGVIYKKQKKGTSKFRSKKIAEQKKKGRRKGPGSKKGTRGARKDSKTGWIETIRPLRRLLKEMKDSQQITKEDYKKLYARAGGGFFRSKKHMLTYMKEHDMLRKSKKEAKTEKQAKPKTAAKPKKPKKSKESKPAR